MNEQFQESSAKSSLNHDKTSASTPGNWSPDLGQMAGSSSRYFGTEKKNRFVKRFRLLLRNGQVFSVPYSLLPIISLKPEAGLWIVTRELEVIIKGRNLQKLEEEFSREQVVWVRESETMIDDEKSEVFIAEINIESELPI